MLEQILDDLRPFGAALVAVSKTKPADAIMALYERGQRIFGENKVQELVEKEATLPKDIAWHLIGHLQSNKVKYIAPFVAMIHSVDDVPLLMEIEKHAARHGRVIDVLFQVKIAREETKFGADRETLTLLCEASAHLAHVNVRGLMGMATFTDDEAQVRGEFGTLRQLFDDVKARFFADKADFDVRSMGMSDDYKWALEEGSTMVRIGSLLFGSRHYGG